VLQRHASADGGNRSLSWRPKLNAELSDWAVRLWNQFPVAQVPPSACEFGAASLTPAGRQRSYYKEARTRLSISKDAPLPRPVHVSGQTKPRPCLGGLFTISTSELDFRRAEVGFKGELHKPSYRPGEPFGCPTITYVQLSRRSQSS
jgi:hypothetical protein